MSQGELNSAVHIEYVPNKTVFSTELLFSLWGPTVSQPLTTPGMWLYSVLSPRGLLVGTLEKRKRECRTEGSASLVSSFTSEKGAFLEACP